jgi:hypothetical protein
MVRRKGAGYMIEVMTALLVMFGFILGNAPSDPATDWSNFQKEVIAEDFTYVMEKTGDTESFIRGGETGSLVTASEALSRDRVTASGTVENVPISRQTVGFNIREIDRYNETVEPVADLGDQCYQDDDLEELSDNSEILRTVNPRAGAYLYVTDSNPSISTGNTNEDYDTVWVDNGTRCQFSSAEGPYYRDEFLYWGDGPGGDHWEFNEIYYDDSSNEGDLELYNSTQIIRLKKVLESEVNDIDTGVEVDSVAVDREDLEDYDILVFRERGTLTTGVLDEDPGKVQDFMSDGSVLLMMDLERTDFYDTNNNLRDNFITSTGLKWVDMPYRIDYRDNPGDSVGGSFTDESESETLQTYFKGVNGDLGNLNLTPAGNISSSNSQKFKRSEALLSSDQGAYQITEWNVTNYSMQQVDPAKIDGYPNTACVEDGTVDGNLTRGNFSFQEYETGEKVEYRAISTKLGEDDKFCSENDIRALNIDLNRNGDYGDQGEGAFLNGESHTILGKRYTVYFPSEEAIQNGTAAEFIYTGDSDIEVINYRTSFEGFPGDKLARLGYKERYNAAEKKMISSVIHWLSEETTEFGAQEETQISTENIGAVKENTFMPYRIALRWR